MNTKGNMPDAGKKTVLIIGARICSEYGRYMARMYGHAMAENGVQVITTMSHGVSATAARAAIKADGKVFAVLPFGVDTCYPPENVDLYDDILRTGGGVMSKNDNAIQRSDPAQYDVALEYADAVIVIEARRRSGVLVAVDKALAAGVPVFAVPGRVTDRLSDGVNDLLKRGAALMTTDPSDVMGAF